MRIDWKRGPEDNETWYGSVDGLERLDVWQDPDGAWGVSVDCRFVGTAKGPTQAKALAKRALRASNPAPESKARLLAYDFSGARNPVTPPGMPLHPTNTILVRLNAAGRAQMGPADLYVWLLYMFNRGYYRPYACGTCQVCIRLGVVRDVPIEGGRKLKHIATFRSGVDPDKLRVGDVLLQRVGTVEGCGRPYIVVGTSPLSTRGLGFRGGRAAGRLPRDFDPVQLERGTLVEMEHTASRRVAQRIAMDHLTEHPDYYIELAKMEAMLRERRRAGNPWIGIPPPQQVTP